MKTQTNGTSLRPSSSSLSAKLDNVIVALDEKPTGIRRIVLLLMKRWYERKVAVL